MKTITRYEKELHFAQTARANVNQAIVHAWEHQQNDNKAKLWLATAATWQNIATRYFTVTERAALSM